MTLRIKSMEDTLSFYFMAITINSILIMGIMIRDMVIIMISIIKRSYHSILALMENKNYQVFRLIAYK